MSVGREASFGLLGAKVGKADYILPGRAAGPMSLGFYPSVVEVQPKDGDQLFGQATIQCPVCSKVRVYWVYMIYGSFGVYAEGKDRDYPFLSFSKENGATVVSTFLKRKDLQPMPTRVEWRGSQACIPSHPGEVHCCAALPRSSRTMPSGWAAVWEMTCGRPRAPGA